VKTFTDAAGRTWTITLNLGTAMAVKDKLHIDLLQPEQGDPPLLTRLGTDELLLGEVLLALLEKQFEANKVTADDVRAGFDGRTLLAAQTAFYEELVDFFQSRGRSDRAKAAAKQKQMIDAAVAAIETKIDQINIDRTIAGVMSGASQDASPSTPSTSGG